MYVTQIFCMFNFRQKRSLMKNLTTKIRDLQCYYYFMIQIIFVLYLPFAPTLLMSATLSDLFGVLSVEWHPPETIPSHMTCLGGGGSISAWIITIILLLLQPLNKYM